jgi:CarD family transcriptional regulator
MFVINDCIFYRSTGVCKIVDIRIQKAGSGEQECYVLKPCFNPNLTLFVPTANDELVTHMRPLMIREEVDSLIQQMPGEESAWIDNDHERCNEYSSRLQSGDSRELIKIIRTLYGEKIRKIAIKGPTARLNAQDARIMSTAENLLHTEFAFVLGIDLKDVVPYIQAHIPEDRREAGVS